MSENENLFNGAIVDENGIITNVLVFDNEDTMREFNALKLVSDLGIGDTYMTPEEYKKHIAKMELKNMINQI